MRYGGRTDDPVGDFLRYDASEEETDWLSGRPICGICNKPIEDDFKYVIGDVTYCEECMKDEFRILID